MVWNKIKPVLSKINFALGRKPKIERCKDFRRFIPEPYESVLLISADFELAWAPRYDNQADNPLEHALELARQERENIPFILNLCEQYNIPITWATVGHLFLESCSRSNGKAHTEIPTVDQYSGLFWDFKGDDWFEYDPCSNIKHAPEWYAPDLIEKIIRSTVDHEIGSHSFSHIDCRDGICSPDLMRADLQVCKALAKAKGLELKSFVHPGNTIGNLKVLKEEGFISFRSGFTNKLSYPIQRQLGLWEYSNTFPINYRNDLSLKYQQNKYIRIIKRAINSNTVCVFWFHPSFEKVVCSQILPVLFAYLESQKDKIWITTHSKYAEWLNTEVSRHEIN
jgi:peptidoglycan/xylan/chitin deacetylase (PgdA/CDA1 family)